LDELGQFVKLYGEGEEEPGCSIQPKSNNHDDNGEDKIKTTHEHKKSTDKKPDNKPKEDSDKKT
jgi:hypothetical protein